MLLPYTNITNTNATLKRSLSNDELDVDTDLKRTPSNGQLDVDGTPRPLKRQRLQLQAQQQLQPIPAAQLLLALPSLLIHPPTHRLHFHSIHLARHALRCCLALDPEQDVQCRAWTGLAELGLIFLSSSKTVEAEVESEVERALTKALPIAQKHPALHAYHSHLTILAARLAHRRHNPRLAHNTLRRLFSSLPSLADAPHTVYSAHLALVDSYLKEADTVPTTTTNNDNKRANVPLQRALDAISALHALAVSADTTPGSQLSPARVRSGHALIALLARLLALQSLIRYGEWDHVAEALEHADREADAIVGGGPSPAHAGSTDDDGNHIHIPVTPADATPTSNPNARATTAIYTAILVLGVVYYTYAGDSEHAREKLTKLHTLLDAGGVAGEGGDDEEGGVVQVHFTHSQTYTYTRPLYLRTTHPRTAHVLAFLVSAVGRREVAGRKPKRGVFLREGLNVLERGGWGGEHGGGVKLPVYASVEDVRAMERRMVLIRADMLADLANMHIQRSAYSEARGTLDVLVAHLRTHNLFGGEEGDRDGVSSGDGGSGYAARVTLLEAQLAHAQGQVGRARQCYRLAEWLASGGCASSGRDEWVRIAARAGGVWLRVGAVRRMERGLGRGEHEGGRESDDDDYCNPKALKVQGEEVVKECRGLGGVLGAVGEVIAACVGDELRFLGAKTHLRRALDLATGARDAHLHGIVLALVAAQYMHTAREHARGMLEACAGVARGLGAGGGGRAKGGVKGGDGDVAGGNVPLGMWVGERFLELYKWEGDVEMVERQEEVNERLRAGLVGCTV